tara:strand:- start:1244 stop:1639 length:396 start_codon:yes stop_codon:yes gene_type:complete
MNASEQAALERAEALPQIHYDQAAFVAVEQLRVSGSAWVRVAPGDATQYVFVIVQLPTGRVGHPPDRIPREPGHYIVASNFAPAHEWHGEAVHVDYAMEKWSPRPNIFTAVATARFLSTLAIQLQQQGAPE